MKVLIVNPPWPGKGFGTRSQNRIIKHRADKFLQFPLLLAYACSQLKRAGHEVYFIDSVIDELGMEETLSRIGEISPDAVLIETTTPSIEYDFDFLRKIKTRERLIIAVGQHVTALPRESLEECKAIDVIIKGEFDPIVAPVLENTQNLSKVKGIAYRKDGKIFDNGPAVWCHNLDELPFPDRETIPFDRYGESWYNLRPFANILTTRGCPYGCTYCISPHVMEGLKWRQRSIGNVMEELKILTKEYCVREINIDDATFTLDKKRVIEFCRALKENNIKLLWTANGRVDNVDEEMLEEMKKAGCKMIRYGVESGDPGVLKKMKKNIKIEKVKYAFDITRKHKILALGGFMFGFPYDTKDSIETTIKVAREIKPDLIQCSIVLPYPGTALYKEAESEGKIIAKSWKEFDMTYGPVVKMKDVSREELDGIVQRMYKEFYFRPSFAIQTIFNIRRLSDIPRNLRAFLTLVRTMNIYRKQGKVKSNVES